MKIILYMAITANGYIATEDDDTSWVSEESWNSYLNIVKQTGCAIVGRRTYELMPEEELVDECLYVVLTGNKDKVKRKKSNVIISEGIPQSVLKMLQGKGFTEVAVVGGGKLNASFMKEGLIDEIYLDVEPVVLGRGIPLFAPVNFSFNLKLLGVKKLNDKTVQVHYSVKK